MSVRIINADVMEGLAQLADCSVQCVVTSPPYWGLRDYGVDGQIGLEDTPEAFVERIVGVFREVRRVLANDGVCWINIGDTYNNSDKWGGGGANTGKHTKSPDGEPESWKAVRRKWSKLDSSKPKDMLGIPWQVALALRADGWWLRRDIIWHKPNAMPESVLDRCSSAHEYVFMLTKSSKYYYNAEAVFEDAKTNTPHKHWTDRDYDQTMLATKQANGVKGRTSGVAGYSAPGQRNKRSVWTIATKPFSEAHFATFPPELPEICIKASTRKGDMVLDPFGGAGTTGLVADRLQREAVLIELNPEYAAMAERRINGDRGALLDAMQQV